jgi:hypothetical protein
MLNTSVIISTFLFLTLIAYQDIRNHSVSWFLFPLAFATTVFNGLLTIDLKDYFLIFLLNLSIVLVMFSGVVLYYFIKNKKLINIIDTNIGIGDLLFLVVLCGAFSLFNFIIFMLLSLIATICAYLTVNVFRKQKSKQIPLAGILSLFYVLLLASNFISGSPKLLDDTFFMNLIITTA